MSYLKYFCRKGIDEKTPLLQQKSFDRNHGTTAVSISFKNVLKRSKNSSVIQILRYFFQFSRSLTFYYYFFFHFCDHSYDILVETSFFLYPSLACQVFFNIILPDIFLVVLRKAMQYSGGKTF